MRFDWHADKNQSTLTERGFDFDFISQLLDGRPTLRAIDTRKDYGEVRCIAFGRIEGRVYVVVFTVREPNICHIISARKANARETRYFKAHEPRE